MRILLFFLSAMVAVSIFTGLNATKESPTDVFEQDLVKKLNQCEKNTTPDALKECSVDLIINLLDKDPHLLPQIYTVLDRYISDEKTTLDFYTIHKVFHEVGMFLYHRMGNPKEAYSLCGDFDSGCRHGLVAEYADNLKDSEYDPVTLFNELCYTDGPGSPIIYSSAVCAHSIGHTTIYKRYGDLQKAFKECDRLPEENEECYTALFMEYTKGESHLGIHSHKSSTISLPCVDIPIKYRSSCYDTSARAKLQIEKPDGNLLEAAQVCNQAGAFALNCYQAVTHRVFRMKKNSITKMKEACDRLPHESATFCHQALLTSKKINGI